MNRQRTQTASGSQEASAFEQSQTSGSVRRGTSTKIVISGASGDLGRRVTKQLQGQAGTDLTLVTRTPQRLAERQAEGITVRRGDYSEPDSLDAAFAGGGRVVPDQRPQPGSPHSRASECDRRRQNGWHPTHRLHVGRWSAAEQSGAVRQGSSSDRARSARIRTCVHFPAQSSLRRDRQQHLDRPGRCSADGWSWQQETVHSRRWARQTSPERRGSAERVNRHAGAVYDITGPELLTVAQIAQIGSEVYGMPITYAPVSQEERLAFFDSTGMPRTYDPTMPPSADGHMWASDELVSADVSQAEDYQAILTHHVKQLTGRSPETLRSVMERVKRALRPDRRRPRNDAGLADAQEKARSPMTDNELDTGGPERLTTCPYTRTSPRTGTSWAAFTSGRATDGSASRCRGRPARTSRPT